MEQKVKENRKAAWLVLLAGALLLGPAASAEQSLMLAWSPGTVTTNLAGYHIYYGADGTNYQYEIDAGTNITYQVTGLQEGQTNTFVVKSYNAVGVDGLPSNMIIYMVPGLVRFSNAGGPGKPPTLSFPVAPGITYQVQASVDLVTWSTIWQTTSTTNVWTQFTDAQGANLKMRFYRLVW